jgi:hypothetical protein
MDIKIFREDGGWIIMLFLGKKLPGRENDYGNRKGGLPRPLVIAPLELRALTTFPR